MRALRTAAALATTLIVLPQTAMAFEGRYLNKRGGMEQEATITRRPGGDYKVVLDVAVRGCIGSFEGVGVSRKDSLLAQAHDPDDGGCKITIRKTRNGIAVKEDACSYWHGAACEFSGNYRKK